VPSLLAAPGLRRVGLRRVSKSCPCWQGLGQSPSLVCAPALCHSGAWGLQSEQAGITLVQVRVTIWPAASSRRWVV